MDLISETLARMYDATPVLVAAYDAQDRLRYANAAFRAAFFIAEGECPTWAELMRRNHAAGRGTVIRNPDFESWLVSTQGRRGKVGFRAFETDVVDGRWLWMTETVQNDGWMLCIATDITSLRAGDRAVRQDRDVAIKASLTDELTGVSNRRFLMMRLREALEAGDGILGTLCLLDLDNFKYVNDAYGHDMGDRVLKDFASCIQSHLRRADCFSRIGGEEFALLLPATQSDEAMLIVERMLAIVRRARPLAERPEFSYSFSAGIAELRPGDETGAVVGRADKALYAAKMAGRNRIHLEAA
ncbi:diguanylate cyclase [Bordetella genomosp. 8]|uniref:diguanylate cyclase n=1 Tax=Bordetella genomosp. 8 TaxID=1416806 RepID=A0A1W6YFD3_9BORD|nr:GGDEF domain-containing protein [Bordetella genomosp. 8]ARP79796.1 diguanylate cyclase [Bordetella genomosp. 8]